MPMHEFPPGFPVELLEIARAAQREENIRRGDDGRHYKDFEVYLPPGTPAPDFNLKTLDGRTISRSDYQNRYLVLEAGSYT